MISSKHIARKRFPFNLLIITKNFCPVQKALNKTLPTAFLNRERSGPDAHHSHILPCPNDVRVVLGGPE